MKNLYQNDTDRRKNTLITGQNSVIFKRMESSSELCNNWPLFSAQL